jgi:hypothetical protein
MLDMNEIKGMRGELAEDRVGLAGREYANRDEMSEESGRIDIVLISRQLGMSATGGMYAGIFRDTMIGRCGLR